MCVGVDVWGGGGGGGGGAGGCPALPVVGLLTGLVQCPLLAVVAAAAVAVRGKLTTHLKAHLCV